MDGNGWGKKGMDGNGKGMYGDGKGMDGNGWGKKGRCVYRLRIRVTVNKGKARIVTCSTKPKPDLPPSNLLTRMLAFLVRLLVVFMSSASVRNLCRSLV